MDTEKIKVLMESGEYLDVVILTKRASAIEVVVGEGVHSVKCELKPVPNGSAYVGSVMGRELIYERSMDEVQEDIDRLNPDMRKSRPPRR